jgi:hypothetical protein
MNLTALTAMSAQAMGSGHNPLTSAGAERAAPIDSAAAGPRFCRAVPLAGTQQRAGGARGSCVVVAHAADNVGGSAGRVRSRTLMQGGYLAQAVRVAAVR